MTDEQRLDRLERIAKLMVKAGLPARRQMREQTENINTLTENINILIDCQIENEKKFSALQIENEKKFNALAESQNRTDERLDAFISTVERLIGERGNGKG